MKRHIKRLALCAYVLCVVGCQAKPPKAEPAPKPPALPDEAEVKAQGEKRLTTYEDEAAKLDERTAVLAQDAASRYVTDYNKTAYEAAVKLLAQKKYKQARKHFDEVIWLAIAKGAKEGTTPRLPEKETARPVLPAGAQYEDYRISAGDELTVTVWGLPELSSDVRVRPDGKLSYPGVGEVKAAGMTIAQLSGLLSKELGKHLDRQQKPEKREEYRICPGDVLHIMVEGAPELSAEIQVAPDGRISFPYIGEISAAGITFGRLAERMSESLRTYVKNPKTIINAKSLAGKLPEAPVAPIGVPHVTVQAKALVGNRVTVLGAVTTPGQYQVDESTRVLDVLAQAGGIVKQYRTEGIFESANLRDAYLMRGEERVPVDFYRLLVDGAPAHNIPVLPADLIFIPTTREKREETVTVLGALRRPGRIRLTPGMRVLDGIAEAGGLFIGSIDQVQLQSAALNKAFLSRDSVIMPVDFVELVFKGNLSHNILLQSNDFIFVPTSEENLVFVLGEVNFPRAVAFTTHMTFSRALAAASGMTLNGSRGAVYLVRGDLKDKPHVERVDAFAVLEGRRRDIDLQPYDIIYVSPTALTETSHIITQILPGLTGSLDVKTLRHGP